MKCDEGLILASKRNDLSKILLRINITLRLAGTLDDSEIIQ